MYNWRHLHDEGFQVAVHIKSNAYILIPTLLDVFLFLGYSAKTAQALLTPSERGYGPPTGQGVDLNNTEPLYVDTNAEAIP